tara:strand:- start:6301 stop:7275 length:975 start_codon:yes stop_codon:yes gene_type:complete
MTVTGVDLPTPQIVEALSFDQVFATLVADFKSRNTGYDALLFSDPGIKLLEVAAYREVVLRQRINDAFKATLLGLATGNDLDNLADFYNVARTTGETDTALRTRVVEKIKGSSTGGGGSWYRYQALTADDRVQDSLVTSPSSGQVQVAILSNEGTTIRTTTGSALDTLGAIYNVTRIETPLETDDDYRVRIRTAALGTAGDGTASTSLITAVDNKLQRDDVRVITDVLTVVSANIVETPVTANIYLYPDTPTSILTGLEDSIRSDFTSEGGLGWNLSRSWLIKKLHLAGVQRVELTSPATDLDIDDSSAAALGTITVNLAGYDR